MSSIDTRNRYAGLISGLDTEEMVKSMAALTKNRINSQKQKLQTLQWKQESYRSIISKIQEFQNKYLRIESPTSIKANAVMKKYLATSSNDKVITASASAGATPANYTIRSATAAKAASVSSEGSVSAGEVNLDFSRNVNGKEYSVNVNFDGADKTITFKGGASVEESKQNFLDAMNSAYKGSMAKDQEFRFKDGTSTLVFDNKGSEEDGTDGIVHTFNIGYNSEGVGIANTGYSRISTSSALGAISFKQALESEDGTYSININGVDFTFNENTTVSQMISRINDSDAGVTISFSNVSQSFKIESKETGAGSEITMYQTKGNLLNALFNKEADELKPVEATKGKYEIDVKGDITGTVTAELKDKLLNGFGDDDGDAAKITLKIAAEDGDLKEITIDLSEALKAKDDGATYTDDEIAAAIKDKIKEQYNAVADEDHDLNDDFSVSYDSSTGQISIGSVSQKLTLGENGFNIQVGSGTIDNIHKANADGSYVVAEGVSEMKFMLDGEEVTVSAANGLDITLNDLVDAGVITMQKDGTILASGNLSLTDGELDSEESKLLNAIFGKTEGIVGASDGQLLSATGSNSKISISSDGGETFTTYTSSSNVFSFDGTSIDVSKSKDFTAAAEEDYITIETARDTSGLKDLIKGFVEDYNKLLSDLYGETSTKRPKSSGSYYDPLTEEQEEEMTDKEIEKWNENAKMGLLYRDNTVQKFLSEIRGAMNTYIDGFGLYNIGIKLTDRWEDNGKLEIDESKLDTALSAYGDKLADLFTDPDNGLAAKLEAVVDKAISTKTNKYGYLTSLAGAENTKTDTDNLIYRQIESIQKTIEKLNEKYEAEQERYWKQFSALETYMANMQAQMSYFTDTSTG